MPSALVHLDNATCLALEGIAPGLAVGAPVRNGECGIIVQEDGT